jgi:hypothetical protein
VREGLTDMRFRKRMLHVASRLLHVACCMLHVASRLLHVARCIAAAARRGGTGAQVFSLVSGGVDSSVCTALLNAALGDAPTSAPGLGSPLPHLRRDRAHPAHIGTGTHCAAHAPQRPWLPTGRNEESLPRACRDRAARPLDSHARKYAHANTHASTHACMHMCTCC